MVIGNKTFCSVFEFSSAATTVPANGMVNKVVQKTDDGVAEFKCVECMRADRAKKLGRGREGEVKGEKENRGKAVQFQRGREKGSKGAHYIRLKNWRLESSQCSPPDHPSLGDPELSP